MPVAICCSLRQPAPCATPVLGGQLAVGVTGIVGNLDTSIAGTLTAQVGPIVATRNGFLSDSLTGVGDLYPMVTLKWNQGVHNYMRRRRKMLDVGEPAPPI